MKIYSVTSAINRSMSPDVHTRFFTDLSKARETFDAFRDEVDDDFATILLEEFDPKTGKSKVLETFEGNFEDLDDEEEESDDD